MENEDADLVELNLAKRKVEDSLPVHIGNCILMNAKLHFLRYFFKFFIKTKIDIDSSTFCRII